MWPGRRKGAPEVKPGRRQVRKNYDHRSYMTDGVVGSDIEPAAAGRRQRLINRRQRE